MYIIMIQSFYEFSETGIIDSTVTDYVKSTKNNIRNTIMNGDVSSNVSDIMYLYQALISYQFFEFFYFINRRNELQKQIFSNDSFQYLNFTKRVEKQSYYKLY